MSMTPAGWYPDTNAPGNERFWDGAQWTEQSRPVAPAAPAEPVAPAAPAEAAAPTTASYPAQADAAAAYPAYPAQADAAAGYPAQAAAGYPDQQGAPGAYPQYQYQPVPATPRAPTALFATLAYYGSFAGAGLSLIAAIMFASPWRTDSLDAIRGIATTDMIFVILGFVVSIAATVLGFLAQKQAVTTGLGAVPAKRGFEFGIVGTFGGLLMMITVVPYISQILG
jgi:hypothetical protein